MTTAIPEPGSYERNLRILSGKIHSYGVERTIDDLDRFIKHHYQNAGRAVEKIVSDEDLICRCSDSLRDDKLDCSDKKLMTLRPFR